MNKFLVNQTKSSIINLEQELKELRIELDELDYFCNRYNVIINKIRNKAEELEKLQSGFAKFQSSHNEDELLA